MIRYRLRAVAGGRVQLDFRDENGEVRLEAINPDELRRVCIEIAEACRVVREGRDLAARWRQ